MRRIALGVLLSLLTVHVLLAQNMDCAALSQKIIESVRQACPTISANQACYGSPDLDIQPRDNVKVAFSKPGDLINLASLQSLTTHAFDSSSSKWGIALANVRADLLNGGLTWVVAGNVSVQNESQAPDDFVALDVTVTYPSGANIRQQPSPDAMLVKTLNNGEIVKAVGRLDDSSWIRLLDGWVSADLIHSRNDLTLLKILTPDDTVTTDIYGPMQTIHLHTGFQDSPCAGASDSGLLVQTPDVTTNVTFVVNGAPLTFAGTIYLQTTADGKSTISVLEGQLTYDNGKTLKVAEKVQYAYQNSDIIYDKPQDYDYARARYLPLQLLPREFELPFSLGGVIFPFTPGTGFLSTISADAACTVAWTVDINIRSGPGTNYPLRRGVSSGFYAHPDARATGTDGAVWWRLLDGIWVAADNTVAAGACGNLPIVEPPPLPQKP